jgi:hypothetical protein
LYGHLWNTMVIFTALGLLCWFISLFLLLPIWGIRFRATGAVLGILLPFFSGIFVPPQGLVNYRSRFYYKVSDPAAVQYLQEFTKSKEGIDQQFVKDEYEQNYLDYIFDKEQAAYKDTETIIVKYELRRGVEREDLPKSFSVIIDRKTKKTEIVSEKDAQQKAKELNEDLGEFITRPERPR